jgi:hypothetical protein
LSLAQPSLTKIQTLNFQPRPRPPFKTVWIRLPHYQNALATSARTQRLSNSASAIMGFVKTWAQTLQSVTALTALTKVVKLAQKPPSRTTQLAKSTSKSREAICYSVWTIQQFHFTSKSSPTLFWWFNLSKIATTKRSLSSSALCKCPTSNWFKCPNQMWPACSWTKQIEQSSTIDKPLRLTNHGLKSVRIKT